jgi:hypothetical protein
MPEAVGGLGREAEQQRFGEVVEHATVVLTSAVQREKVPD